MKTNQSKAHITITDFPLHQITDGKNPEDHQSLLVSIINSTSDAIISKTPEGIITIWNRGAEKLFGYAAGEAIGKNISMLIPHHYTNEEPGIIEDISNGKHIKQYETQWRRKDGSLIDVSLTICTRPISLDEIADDVADRKNNEQELKNLNKQLIKKAEELAASNAELERFAYVASHDLQEPLRMVNSFLQLLQKKYKDQLDETALQYIGYAVDGGVRMKKLILDLLEYSRIGTNKDEPADTDINEVVTEVLKTFSSKIRDTGAVINGQPMPVVKASKTQITQLFQNLLSNALKYNTSFVPEIEMGCEDKGDVWQFFVKDNGIGIEDKFLDKVFIIFQRLHNKNRFSGTGIGLAICKKIADRHGGAIWIESRPGSGSTFFFTIKK